MKNEDDINTIKVAFEERLFHYGLIVAFIYTLIEVLHDFLIHSSTAVKYIGIFNLILILVLYRAYLKNYTVSIIIFYGQALFTLGFWWNSTAGWGGSTPYTSIVLMVFIIFTSHGYLQVITLALYGLAIISLAYVPLPGWFGFPNDSYTLTSLEADFFLNTLTLILITVYLKAKFHSYTESVELTNERLRKSSETLVAQTKSLSEQQMQLNAVRNNLEDMISAKIDEVQDKAKTLKDYAFVNAHHVRGPLARIFGLIYLMELEGMNHYQSQTLHKIKVEAENMDAIIKRINEITS
jgi:signal transduction histidine kinase